MRKTLWLTAGVAAIAAVAAVQLPTASAAAPTPSLARHASMGVCSTAKPGFAACSALVRTDAGAMAAKSGAIANAAAPNATVSGLSPANLQSAYKLPSSSAGSGQTVAIVDAMDDPTVEADLGTYRSQFGLSACTTANGCFRKVDQNGGTSFPATDSGWALEISLDVDMVSAICPNCHILLVEASSASFNDLATAVDRAATMGANAISNSYGGSESGSRNIASHYSHSGIQITASSGDNGFGVSFPASANTVTSVGGTTLNTASNSRGWTETAWSGAGSGCSRVFSRPSGQANAGTGCSRRAIADVSAVADPNTGVAVFDSTPFQNQSGWFVVGGTSASSPIIASTFALAGNASSVSNNTPYSHTANLFDVTSGSNGSCNTSQQCNARAGWDGPTGLGTPNGVGAF
jgi:subtilase family serine protease